MTDRFDVIILGGGPAGATAATLLAEAGRRVLVLEKSRFPRFHIGESLLPASVRLFERLGVNEALKEAFIYKPGGKWLYGAREVPGDFSNSDRHATFKPHPYSYLVERSTFDKILLDRAAEVGADVRFEHEVAGLMRGSRADHGGSESDSLAAVRGVRVRDEQGREVEFTGDLVIDCTGLRSFVGSQLDIRRPAHDQRMGIYAQYRAEPMRDDIHEGWFIGQMYYDGWTWLLRLPQGRFSVGTVLSVERFKQTGATPEELLSYLVANNPLLRDGMTPDPPRISPVEVTGHMGNRCSHLAGDGWVLAGDAAFFVDPCYSSGVHLALQSAEWIADTVLQHRAGARLPADAFNAYQRRMFHHERAVVRMVEAFYIASRNTSVQKVITRLQGGYLTRKFVTFVGGDFSVHSDFAWRVLRLSQLVAAIGGNDDNLAPETHPQYLIRELRARSRKPAVTSVGVALKGAADARRGQSIATLSSSSAAASTSPLLSEDSSSA
jgi:flavin-dependent dehydrogenase